jgi:peptidoglycan/xylan/chitin deacetylase (PgdA/CDA1 family)
MLEKGVFLLDIEVELAWGIMTSPGYKERDMEKAKWAAKREREFLEDVLAILDAYEVPVTWDILGHAILDACERDSKSNLPHSEMPRPSYKWMKRDWYWFDPCTTLQQEPTFYGKDITDRIVDFLTKAKVEHDIGCHSFSHMLFGDKDCSEEVAETDVKKVMQLLKDNYGIEPEVFIFPRNSVGHIDVLRRNGIKAFRGPIPHTINYEESGGGLGNSLRKVSSLALQFASFYLRTPPPLVMPIKEQGLVNIPASLCYSKPSLIPLNTVIARAKKGIRKAVETKKIFHLYTHLINFGAVANAQEFLKGFEEILKYAHANWKVNALEMTTMRRISQRLSE